MTTYTHADMISAFEQVKKMMPRLNGNGSASFMRFKKGMNDAAAFEADDPTDERIQLAREWAMGAYKSLHAIAR